ncbi:hypothetical protein Forpe1208_v003326 [Fusarium oxysporum f. sp. rapae]|uniref:Fucose-specific lectin n=1 Tax=Fusarium oxysporum f. sp. rapae TaxID=485398 RepID=A0A8J5PHT6_FUSOX|nr:hypothetical protein Forpe1208_v003326 [Fusarium oxysporum f. sp. rapae]
MPDELHLSSDPREQKPRSSMTLNTTLDDGTTINLTVSPASTASSAVTASTTFTHTSFSFQINTLPLNQALTLRTVSPSPEAPCSQKHQPSDRHPNPISTNKPRIKHSSSSKMPDVQLPEDIVAIDTGERSLLFYVAPDENGSNQLSYLESPDQYGVGNYKVVKIGHAEDKNPENDNKRMRPIIVSGKNKQVAAITWKGSEGIEIRVYYVAEKSELLREVCKTGNGGWYIGALSYYDYISNPFKVVPGTSISASVHIPSPGKYNLRVFAVEEGKAIKGVPQIYVYKFKRDLDSGKDTWDGGSISSKITEY